MLTIYHRTIKDPKLETVPVVKVGSWINVVDPSREEIRFLTDLGLVPENIEDALDPDELPRSESKEGWLYVILNVPYEVDGTVRKVPLLVVLAPEFILTLCKMPFPFVDQLLGDKNCYTTQKVKNLLNVCVKITDTFTQKIRRIDKSMAIKRGHLSKLSDADIVGMIELEEVLNEFNSSLVAQIGVFEKIISSKVINIFQDDKELAEDLIIDSRQCMDMCNTSIKSLANMRAAYSAILTNNLNKVIKFLTSLTALLAIPTIVASLFGMNVDLPMQGEPFAFALVVVLTLVLVVVSVLFFYFKRWL
jgi:magnesium transporter